MQLVRMTYEGRKYDLGYISPVYLASSQWFALIPAFSYAPPFLEKCIKSAQSRLIKRAKEHLRNGGEILPMCKGLPLEIAPVYHEAG